MKLFLIAAITILSGCTSITHLSDSENTWVSVKVGISDNIYYCINDKTKTANPICYKAEIMRRGETFTPHRPFGL